MNDNRPIHHDLPLGRRGGWHEIGLVKIFHSPSQSFQTDILPLHLILFFHRDHLIPHHFIVS
ncbi:MAG: hypothetical protein ACJAT6_000416 [Akkermansiaceae bacterium]|jgi:hypothetical protein|tara:strand:- start:212 stop:397 length:186 start_codon:yes stop_codon:yes gene_type:complete